MNKKPLIVGVDPGSTSAVAAVTVEGEVELLESGKNFPPRQIIQRIIKVGKPVVTASDKGKTPSKVSKISSSLGTRLFEPDEDLSQKRKKELGKGANNHELDALASAIHAQKQLHKEIQKIEKLEKELEKERVDIAEKIFNEQPVKQDKDKEEENEEELVEETENVSEKDQEKLRLERKIENLENHVQRLKSELGEKESENESLKAKLSHLRDEERKEVWKEEEVQKRDVKIKQKNQEIEDLKQEIEDYKVREKQYRKAIHKLFEEDYELVPVVDQGVEEVPEKAVTHQDELQELLEKRGANIYPVEEVEGLELKNYFVVEDFPEPKNFESIIQNYKDSR
jgi:predicted RNase H-like nuclease (RuvC/YqgF family)